MKQPKLNDLKIDGKGTKALRAEFAKAKKVKITINVDEDLLMQLREIAQEEGTPYQSLLNRFLKNALSAKDEKDTRLSKLEREVEKLKKKISA